MKLSRNEILEKLSSVMELTLSDTDIDVSLLSEQSELVKDVGLDSVGILYLVVAIEEFFGVRFDDVSFADFKTVGDVIDYIEENLE